jgi:hypothetical protein
MKRHWFSCLFPGWLARAGLADLSRELTVVSSLDQRALKRAQEEQAMLVARVHLLAAAQANLIDRLRDESREDTSR